MTIGRAVRTYRLADVRSYLKFGDHFSIEHRKITRLSAGYNSVVIHYFLVHPIGSGVADVGFQRRPGSHRS